MKLTERFYANPYGVNGLVADLPTKKPKRKKEAKVKVGEMVQCETYEFIYPFRGYVENIYSNSALIRIKNVRKSDKETAKMKNMVTIVPFENMKSLVV